ncbi:MAG: hypothetical protein DHS20C20_11740 [Ardenticatenaceae bacterium]|nr:MAG: hypothetical protein DHS20C20_11740 [Ardenticatenaceae bacterium]
MSAPVIQAQYDDLAKIAERFAQQADLIQQMQQQVRQATDALKNGGWQGQGADAFHSEMDGEVFPAVNRLNHALQEGSQSTRQIIEIIKAAEEEAANPFGSNGQGGLVGGTPIPVPGITPTPSGSPSGGGSDLISTIGGFFQFASDVESVYSGIDTIYDFAKLSDNFSDFLAQRSTMAVGAQKMFTTTAGRIGLGLSIIGAGFEVYDDLMAGQSVSEVLISEGIELGAETGIRLLAYTNPVSAIGLTAWDGISLLGDVTGWYDVPSLGDATDFVGNVAYDAGEAIVDFGGGLMDDVGDAVSSLKFW